jgi:putative acyl-CoA dehydrogenase
VCLDVLRAAKREPEAVAALVAELDAARGANRAYDVFVAQFKLDLAEQGDDPWAGRRLAQAIALAMQASLLVRHAPAAIAAAFCATRLAPLPYAGGAFGALPPGSDAAAIIARALPG